MSAQNDRKPAECPPGESLTAWLKGGRRQTGRQPRGKVEQRLHERLVREIEKLVPEAIAQARKGKPALLRMILRATR